MVKFIFMTFKDTRISLQKKMQLYRNAEMDPIVDT